MFKQASQLETASFDLDISVKSLRLTMENLYDEMGVPKNKHDKELRAFYLYQRINLYTSQMELALDRIEDTNAKIEAICADLYNYQSVGGMKHE